MSFLFRLYRITEWNGREVFIFLFHSVKPFSFPSFFPPRRPRASRFTKRKFRPFFPKFLFVDHDRRFFPPFSSSSFFFFRPKIHEFPTNQRIVKRWGAVCCLKDSAEFVRKRVRVSNSAWSEHGGRSICAHIIIQIPV